MNKNYVAGRNFEYQRRKVWEKLGYTVLRTAGSHGFADLIAVRPGNGVTFIQCKRVETEVQADKLIIDFQCNPPIEPSRFYKLCLEVYIKDSKRVETIYA